ncbi:hypothetical protein CAPTEDRAFT_220894 [Capitella teleta]|uniref:THAP-type domain-containing protein n=1 Tax=Capitella teleta TaxID=283909 RepID=R7V719_CAPTE|nr:hypothetical protein CAPTEDRAFT_220894 [Capitella teleta]|eukprot:ELU14237.1 hypothetical protein CAPTEDRAFT_220894 [Capitella teleta]
MKRRNSRGSKYCCVPSCGSDHGTVDPRTGKRVRYHCFPQVRDGNHDRLWKWIANMGRDDLTPETLGKRKVCSLHFERKAYSYSADISVSQLLHTGVPTIFERPKRKCAAQPKNYFTKRQKHIGVADETVADSICAITKPVITIAPNSFQGCSQPKLQADSHSEMLAPKLELATSLEPISETLVPHLCPKLENSTSSEPISETLVPQLCPKLENSTSSEPISETLAQHLHPKMENMTSVWSISGIRTLDEGIELQDSQDSSALKDEAALSSSDFISAHPVSPVIISPDQNPEVPEPTMIIPFPVSCTAGCPQQSISELKTKLTLAAQTLKSVRRENYQLKAKMKRMQNKLMKKEETELQLRRQLEQMRKNLD